MRPFRNSKLASLIEHELSRVILKEFEFENALVTITKVEVSSDLLQAKIKLGIIPKEKELEIYRAVDKRGKELQYKIFKKINIRQIPKFIFEIDEHKAA